MEPTFVTQERLDLVCDARMRRSTDRLKRAIRRAFKCDGLMANHLLAAALDSPVMTEEVVTRCRYLITGEFE